MSVGPIATVSDDTGPELWMEKLEACRQAAEDAKAREMGQAPEPEADAAVTFDDESD